MKRVRVNGVSLGYVDEGRGVPVVFVHGSYSGPWPDDGEHYSQQTQFDDLAAFIRGLDAGPAHRGAGSTMPVYGNFLPKPCFTPFLIRAAEQQRTQR
jgi:pimeloyl-ACP methyl ester carboxylesterase